MAAVDLAAAPAAAAPCAAWRPGLAHGTVCTVLRAAPAPRRWQRRAQRSAPPTGAAAGRTAAAAAAAAVVATASCCYRPLAVPWLIAVCSTHAWKSSTCVSEADRQAGGRAGKQARRPGRYMWPVGATVAPAPGAGRRLSRHGAALGAQSLLSANKANCGESGAGGTGRQPMASGAMSGGQVNALSQGCLCTSGYPPNETHLTSCRAGPSRARSRLRRVNY